MDSRNLLRHKVHVIEHAAPYFDILAPPRWAAPMVFNSPHSGQNLPNGFAQQSRLSENQLHASEDCYVDELFSGCVDAGAPLMRSLISRSFLDLNREPYELDARMFQGKLPVFANTASPRVASGLGTIPRTVGDGLLIYNGPLQLEDALARVETYYCPYHRMLGNLLDQAYDATGFALLVDCHSMPSSAVSHFKGTAGPIPDIVLGDRFGSACEADIVGLVETHLTTAGLIVLRNKPYSGGFFTENHGRPRQNRHALQIEINRHLYMNETSRLKKASFQALQNLLSDMSKSLAIHIAPQQKHLFAAE
jgi:N-formylglutamate amidohydrolase